MEYPKQILTKEFKTFKRALEKLNECAGSGGDLNYIRAESNGHVWGGCKTPGCLNWAM